MFTAIARAVAEWKANKEEGTEQDLPEEENIYPEDVSRFLMHWQVVNISLTAVGSFYKLHIGRTADKKFITAY